MFLAGGARLKGRRLFINTIFMTATSLLLRAAGLVFQVFLSRHMGAAGVGLFYLILSVSTFAATIAISGVRFATTRIVSEEVGRGRLSTIGETVKRCLWYGVTFGFLASFILYFSSGFIGANIIDDTRSVLALRLLAAGMPFLSAGAVLSGYFVGVCRVGRSAVGAISEELFKIGVSVWLISLTPPENIEMMCAAVVCGNVVGEVISFFVMLFLYIGDRRQHGRKNAPLQENMTLRIFGVAMPLALSAYARTALSTIQNVLVPKGLRCSGQSAEMSLSGYGTIQGMVFPIITFPAVLFSAVSELIVPELTEEQVCGHNRRVSHTANLLLRMCFSFSAGVMGALVCFSDELGFVIYKSAQVGEYVRALAFLMPIMYMDTVTDGMLRGLGQHMYSMGINIVDSLLSTALVWFLLPKYAIYGYILILYLSEIFNFFLSLRRLSSIADIRLDMTGILKTTVSVFGAVNITKVMLRFVGGSSGAGRLISGMALFFAVYCVLLFLLRTVERSEMKRIRSALKNS